MRTTVDLRGIPLVKALSTHELAANAVQQHILDTDVLPGTSITEKNLTETFTMSRPTAKDALRLLVRRGILTQVAYHSAYVPEITESEYQDMLIARRVVDTAVIEHMTDNTGADTLDTYPGTFRKLRGLVMQLSSELDPTRKDVIQSEIEFHDALVHGTGSPNINVMNESLTHVFHLALVMLDKSPDPAVLTDHHTALIDGLAQDESAALAAMHAHIAYFEEL